MKNFEAFKERGDVIWNIANLLRGPYRPPQYRRVMIPLTVLRRLDCVLEETKDKVVAEHKKRFGGLDVLVNSAGIGIAGTVESLSAKHLDLTIGVNLRGLFLVTQKAIPMLRESRGWIVNLASIAGTLPTPGLSSYGATKAAVISLTRSLNEELDADGVRAVAICPGFVDTPMAEWSGIPGDEMIQPEDCAEIVRMCLRLSPHARVPQVVIERTGSSNGDVPLAGA